jgi:D-lactate dehydrogenase
MRVAVFSTKPYDRKFLEQANEAYGHELTFFEPRLTRETAPLTENFDAVCPFVNDQLDAQTIEAIHENGVRLIALRCAGFNNVDLPTTKRLGLTVVRVPAYSPHAVADHTVGLMLSLNRRIHHAFNRVREGNFALDGLLGFDMIGRTVGVVGTGKIGEAVARILVGFGCRLLAYDPYTNQNCVDMGVEYADLERLYRDSDILTLHMPLSPQTHHLINAETINKMKRGMMLINTSRGGLLDTPAVIEGLKSGRIGYLGLDVYEEEADLFFENLSGKVIRDDIFARLLTFPNVLITGHQAFFTRDALAQIADTTLSSVTAFERGEEVPAVRLVS